MFFLFFTCWGSFCGAGHFVGFAGSAAANGYGAYWAYAGDAILGYLVFSWWMAPKLAKYDYYTMPQYIANHLCGNDLTVRRIGGIIPGFVSTFVILWVGCKVFKPEYPIGGKPLTEGYVNHECE